MAFRPGSASRSRTALGAEGSAGVPPPEGVRGASAGRTRDEPARPRINLREYLAEEQREGALEEGDEEEETIDVEGRGDEDGEGDGWGAGGKGGEVRMEEGREGEAEGDCGDPQSLPVHPSHLAEKLAAIVRHRGMGEEEGEGQEVHEYGEAGAAAEGLDQQHVVRREEEHASGGEEGDAGGGGGEGGWGEEGAGMAEQYVDGGGWDGQHSGGDPHTYVDAEEEAAAGEAEEMGVEDAEGGPGYGGGGAGQVGSDERVVMDEGSGGVVEDNGDQDGDDVDVEDRIAGLALDTTGGSGAGSSSGLGSPGWRSGSTGRPTSARPTSARPASARLGRGSPSGSGRSGSGRMPGGPEGGDGDGEEGGGGVGGMGVILEQSEGGVAEDEAEGEGNW